MLLFLKLQLLLYELGTCNNNNFFCRKNCEQNERENIEEQIRVRDFFFKDTLQNKKCLII